MFREKALLAGMVGLLAIFVFAVSSFAQAENVMESALQTLQKAGVKDDNDGMSILKRYAYYLSEINQGNAFGHWDVGGAKKNPPVYDFVAFSVMAYKGTVEKIVANALAGKDAFEGMTGFLERAYISTVDKTLDSYITYVPTSYDKTRKYPLVVLLHGLGEAAYLAVTTPAHQPFLDSCEKHQFIMVAPNGKNHPNMDSKQPNFETSLYMNAGEQDVLQVIELAKKAYNIDEQRVYLTGLSMGGFGTWYLGSRHPEMFAAIAPVCGFGTGKLEILKAPAVDVNALKAMPIYVFHGDIDPVVPVTDSREMVSSLKAIGADVTYEEFKGVQHNAWDYAYDNDRLFQWFLKHPKK